MDSGPGQRSHYSNLFTSWLVQVSKPSAVRFSAPIQTGHGNHPAFYTMGTRSFLDVKRPGVTLATHPHQAPRLKKE
jgi:hypothetical protein